MKEPSSNINLNVLLLAEDFYPTTSGGAFIDWNVAKYLADCEDNVTVVTPNHGSARSLEIVNDVEIRRPFSGPPEDIPPNSFHGQLRRVLFILHVFPYLIRLMVSREFDVIYSTNHLFHPVAAVLRFLFRVPLVTFVGYSVSLREEVDRINPLLLLERMNFRFFMGDRTLCRTPSVKKELERLSNAQVDMLGGIVDEEHIKTAMTEDDTGIWPSESKGNGTIRLIFVGRLTVLKNPVKLVNILSELPEHYSLLFIGDGPRRSTLENVIQQKSLNDRTYIAGRLPHKQTLSAIHKSDLFLLPSTVEAYPTVVFEALSLRTPVLATPVGVLPTIEHPYLTTAPLDKFDKLLPNINLETGVGIDNETLERFSVTRFTRDVRKHIIQSILE